VAKMWLVKLADRYGGQVRSIPSRARREIKMPSKFPRCRMFEVGPKTKSSHCWMDNSLHRRFRNQRSNGSRPAKAARVSIRGLPWSTSHQNGVVLEGQGATIVNYQNLSSFISSVAELLRCLHTGEVFNPYCPHQITSRKPIG